MPTHSAGGNKNIAFNKETQYQNPLINVKIKNH